MGSYGECAPNVIERIDCPICLAGIGAQDTAMLCVGESGVYHYFHAECLEGWMLQCHCDLRCPRCPLCQGTLLQHRGRLSNLLCKPTAQGFPLSSGTDVEDVIDPVVVSLEVGYGFLHGVLGDNILEP